AIDACGSELAEQVLVEIALGVAAVERKILHGIDRLHQQRRLLDHQLGVFHERGELTSIARRALGQSAEVWENLVPHMREHQLRPIVAPALPTAILLVSEKASRKGTAAEACTLLVAPLVHVEQTAVHEEGDLLDDGERIGNAAGPEVGPEGVDTTLEFACDHTFWSTQIFELVLTVGDTMQPCLGAIVRPHGCQPALERRAWRDSNATAEANIGVEALAVGVDADLPHCPLTRPPSADHVGREERLVRLIKVNPAVVDTGLDDGELDVLHAFLFVATVGAGCLFLCLDSGNGARRSLLNGRRSKALDNPKQLVELPFIAEDAEHAFRMNAG